MSGGSVEEDMELSFIADAGQPLEIAVLIGGGNRSNARYQPASSGSTVIDDLHDVLCQHIGLDCSSDHTVWRNLAALASNSVSEGL
jgi:hypothetical protein